MIKQALPAFVALGGFLSAGFAQTNLPASDDSHVSISPVVEIFADQAEFDLKSNIVVYRGNVRLDEPKMKMTCELLTAMLTDRGGRINSVVAERNVAIDLVDPVGQKIRGTCQKATYTYMAAAAETNELVELTGNPILQTGQGTLTGDVITYDRITGKLRATNQKMIVRTETPSDTDRAVATTNPPVAPAPAGPADAQTNSIPEPPAADLQNP